MARINLPSHLAEAHGRKNYTKAELEEKRRTEVVMDGSNIKPSPFLPEELHEKFHWFVEQFEEYGIFADVDSDSLSKYVMADYHYWQLNEKLASIDVTDEEYHRTVNTQQKFFNQSVNLAKELGLTMVSRSKLSREEVETEKEQSPEEKLFGNALGLN